MSPRAKQILLVDDEERLLDSIARRMELLGFVTFKATSGPVAIEIARQHDIDLAIVDFQMPGMDGLVTITKLKEYKPGLKTILLTGHGNDKVKQATESLNSVYFQKDEMGDFWKFIRMFNPEGNVVVIRPSAASVSSSAGESPSAADFSVGEIEIRAERQPGGREEPAFENPSVPGRTGESERPRIVGETPAMQELRKNIERVAALDCTVVIRGETGTGKALAARAIHALSRHRNHRFLAIDCYRLGNQEMLGILFGYKERDLSEAIRNRSGIFGTDPGGTLLFENVADMSDELQGQLLKIIDWAEESKHYQHIENKPEARILVATRTDLTERVEAGTFRRDLYHRLNLFELRIPPLRERKDDIAPLCSYFLSKYRSEFRKPVERLTPEVLDTFSSYDFPGNVRELEHIIERAVIIADGASIEKKHLPVRFKHQGVSIRPSEPAQLATLSQVKERYILEVLQATRGNKTRAAEILGISRAALWRHLKQLKVDPSDS
jgi:two-component system response regulator AtoC